MISLMVLHVVWCIGAMLVTKNTGMITMIRAVRCGALMHVIPYKAQICGALYNMIHIVKVH